jgi:hypothetical protein
MRRLSTLSVTVPSRSSLTVNDSTSAWCRPRHPSPHLRNLSKSRCADMKKTNVPPIPPLSFLEPDTPVAICSPVLLWKQYVQALPEAERREITHTPSVHPPLSYSPSLFSPLMSPSFLNPRMAPCPRSPQSSFTASSSSSSTFRAWYGAACSIADSTSRSTFTYASAASSMASGLAMTPAIASNPRHSRIARIQKMKSQTLRDTSQQHMETRASRLAAKENGRQPHQVGWSEVDSPVLLHFKRMSQERRETVRERRFKFRSLLWGEVRR